MTKIPAEMVHALSDALVARAESLHDLALTVRRYEPLSLDEMRLVGECLRLDGELCEAWEKVVRELAHR